MHIFAIRYYRKAAQIQLLIMDGVAVAKNVEGTSLGKLLDVVVEERVGAGEVIGVTR